VSPPEITTARMRLRPLTSADVDGLVPVYTDPEVTRFFQLPVPDRSAVRQVVGRRLSRPMAAGMGSWVLDLDGQVAGLAHLWPSRYLPGSVAEAGWMLGRRHWGRGLATEAAAGIIEHGLYRLGLPAVWALVHQDNSASLAVARRLSLLDVGTGDYHGAPHRVLVALPETAGALHHVELWVPNLARTEASLGWLLSELGWRQGARRPGGTSWHRGSTYLMVVASPNRGAEHHDRHRPERNHLALHVADTDRVDELTSMATARGWRLLFADRHPHAGGDHRYAAYLEDADGFEVELVASGTPPFPDLIDTDIETISTETTRTGTTSNGTTAALDTTGE
jgi:RimJ/RimL family protein N-acetyltransferase/catechol 2,3-dioxygenase-like lactoylglutathione lyase family enzyme